MLTFLVLRPAGSARYCQLFLESFQTSTNVSISPCDDPEQLGNPDRVAVASLKDPDPDILIILVNQEALTTESKCKSEFVLS